MNAERGNIIKYYTLQVCRSILLLAVNGAILQTFLLEYGMSAYGVSIYVAVMQIIQILIYVFVSPKVDQVKNVIRFTGYSFVLCIPMLFVHMILSYQQIDLLLGQVLLYITGILCNLFQGIYNVMECKIPYRIMNMKRFVKNLSVSIVIANIVSSLGTVLLTFLLKTYEYFPVMFGVYLLVFILTISALIIMLKMKDIYQTEMNTKIQTKKIRLWKYEPFRSLAGADILRGINYGFVSIAVTIGYHMDILDNKTASIMVVVTNIMLVAGNLFIVKNVNAIGQARLIFISSIMIAITLPLMMIGKNVVVFVIFYGVVYFFVAMINTLIPAVITKIVDYEVIAQYNGWRLLLFTFSTAFSNFICIAMLELFGGIITMIIAGLMQLLSGFLYYRYYKRCHFS